MKTWALLLAVAWAVYLPAKAGVDSYPAALTQVRAHAASNSLRQGKLLLRLAAALEKLRRGGEVNARDEQGYTALMLAVQAGEYDTADLLLRHHANPHLLAPGRTPMLMLAARGGNSALYRRIRGLAPLSPQATDAAGRTLFHYACSGGNMLICNEILREGGQVYARDAAGHSCLTYAAQSGNALLFYELINRGSNPRLLTRDGYDLLMAAAQGGSPELAEAALNIGCSPLASDIRGCTALMEAARHNAEAVIDILLQAGADTEARDQEGATAAMLAAAVGNADSFYRLGGRANIAPDRHGRTALVYAACGGNPQLVTDLLLQGEDPAVRDRLPLRAAMMYGHTRAALEIASYLPDIDRDDLHAIPIHTYEDAIYFASFLAERCNIPTDRARAAILARQLRQAQGNKALLSGRDDSPYGYTLLQNTILINFPGLFAFLLEQGADVNATDRYGRTPLMSAIECGNLAAIQRLMEAGAKLDVMDDEGYSALMLTALHGWTAAFNLLMEHGADASLSIPGGPTVQSCALSAGAEGEEMLKRLSGQSAMPTTQAEAYAAICEAMHNNNRALVEKLLEAWPDANAADEQGRTLLMYAAGDSCPAFFLSLLIERGADVNAADSRNRMPLQYVKTPEKRNLLLRAGAIP